MSMITAIVFTIMIDIVIITFGATFIALSNAGIIIALIFASGSLTLTGARVNILFKLEERLKHQYKHENGQEGTIDEAIFRTSRSSSSSSSSPDADQHHHLEKGEERECLFDESSIAESGIKKE